MSPKFAFTSLWAKSDDSEAIFVWDHGSNGIFSVISGPEPSGVTAHGSWVTAHGSNIKISSVSPLVLMRGACKKNFNSFRQSVWPGLGVGMGNKMQHIMQSEDITTAGLWDLSKEIGECSWNYS